MEKVIIGILIPFLGTVLGSAMVFFMKDKVNNKLQKLLLGFSAGVMVAASIWSLIIPSIEQGEEFGEFNYIPAVIGILAGFVFLIILDYLNKRIRQKRESQNNSMSNISKNSLLVFSITLHNIPEGMAVGVALAGAYFGNSLLSLSSAIALSIGVAIQNIPEGAIISIPMKLYGKSKIKSFWGGVLSGLVEPIFAGLTFFITGFVTSILPYVLAFAAGSMLYVVIEEIIPESEVGDYSELATIGFAFGFIIMLVLDLSLG